MQAVSEIKQRSGQDWLPAIYEKKIRTLRTRSFQLAISKREHRAVIQHTLLGIELKVGNKRFSCPDLSTARYLQVFARFGCLEFAVPYDITKIAALADELESAWQRALLIAEKLPDNVGEIDKKKLRTALIRTIRSEIEALGAGPAIPEFNQNTKQRSA
ncbi:MAG: hypothetical protein KIS76_02100 [Pyrinomonadaceae bacterium]|nr:hypothetical protein [Pyrinomonadaceae bacterium]